MRVTKGSYKLTAKSGTVRSGRKSTTIPDQSMSIQEIVKRYVRGVPVDILQREQVYLDQSDHDFEKISRMDFGDKAMLADEFAQKAEDVQAEYNERVSEAVRERDAKRKKDEAKESDSAGAGIDNLDNTMPDDTSLTDNKLGGKKAKAKS